MNYLSQLKHPKWQKKRLKILERDDFTCQVCGDKETELHVHHNSYKGNPWNIDDSELITVCKFCHKLKHKISNFSSYIVKKIKLKSINITIYLLLRENLFESYSINHNNNDEVEFNGIFPIEVINLITEYYKK